MLTLEDTDVAIKRAEQYLHLSDGAGAVIKDKVAFKADVGDDEDRDAKFAAMEENKRSKRRKSKLSKRSSAGIQRGPSAAAMVCQCR
jgi:hypothetical protein